MNTTRGGRRGDEGKRAKKGEGNRYKKGWSGPKNKGRRGEDTLKRIGRIMETGERGGESGTYSSHRRKCV